jgi:hypothetical protein
MEEQCSSCKESYIRNDHEPKILSYKRNPPISLPHDFPLIDYNFMQSTTRGFRPQKALTFP